MPEISEDKKIEIRDPIKKTLICSINKEEKTADYFLVNGCAQEKYIKRIAIQGFASIPTGLKKNGQGFTNPGYLLIKEFFEKFNEFKLTISKENKTTLKKTSQGHEITLNHSDLALLLRELRTIKNEQFGLCKKSVANFLGDFFPDNFKKEESGGLYKGNSLYDVLNKKEVLKNLSVNDVNALSNFYPQFVDSANENLKGKARFIAITKSKKKSEVIYLDSVIKEYESRLKKETHSENDWQKFLKDYILVFNSNYSEMLEKENIALEGKYPDFMLLDIYNYLDIYEIKKPTTNLLKYDKSRGNYYWDVEMAKAISQVENYIHSANKNSSALREEIKRKKNIEIKVVKPRGIIVAGNHGQLKGEIMEDNFRLLNNSIKDIQIVLYDELLGQLKNLKERLKK